MMIFPTKISHAGTNQVSIKVVTSMMKICLKKKDEFWQREGVPSNFFFLTCLLYIYQAGNIKPVKLLNNSLKLQVRVCHEFSLE